MITLFYCYAFEASVNLYNLYNFIIRGGNFDYEVIFFCALIYQRNGGPGV